MAPDATSEQPDPLSGAAVDGLDLATASAVETAAAVRSGRLTARAAVEAALARIEARDPALNAFTVVRAAEALAEADALDAGGPGHDGPLAGVPIAVKEEYDVAGLPTTLGGRGNSTPVAADSEVIRRVRAAGAIIVGKTTMPEFGQFPFTHSDRYGVTQNPWAPGRYPGGSSGGSAVAVAAGMVPLALGADGGGSIRIPASACGIVGLKPTRGLVSLAPLAQHWYGLVALGGLSRTVADTALLLDVIAGASDVDRWRVPVPPTPFAEVAAQSPGHLRIATTTASVLATQRTDPEVAAAVERVADALTALGHDVRATGAHWPVPTAAFLPQLFAGMATEAASVEHPELLEPRTRQTARMAFWARPRVVERALRMGHGVAAAVDDRVLGRADVVVLATQPVLTPEVGLLDGVGSLRAMLRSMPYVANTAIANVTGHPAISVPAGFSRDGVPIGVQLLARRGQDGLLLALAAQLEGALGRPAVAPA